MYDQIFDFKLYFLRNQKCEKYLAYYKNHFYCAHNILKVKNSTKYENKEFCLRKI